MAARRKTLDTLTKVRKQLLDDAHRALVDALERESEAAGAFKEAQHAIRREHDCAASLDAGDAAVEAFARWLPEGRRVCAEAEARLAAAQAATLQARAQLNLSRAAAEAASELLAEDVSAARTESERKLQAALDDAGLRVRRE
jgi:hypothetical protein